MTRLFISSSLLVLFTTTACSSKTDEAAVDSSGIAAASSDTAAGMSSAHDMSSMDGMAPMTGDPDRDFLRMMSDHHKGMLLMTEPALAKGVTVKDEARRLANAQTAEIATMTATLKSAYSDDYEPKGMPTGIEIAGEINSQSGNALDKAFLEHTIMHHKSAVTMVDEYLPKAKRADVRAMAEKIKATQLKEITEFEGKLAAL